MTEAVRYYRVSPRFWSRAEQRGWNDDTKLLALYLLTGSHRTTEGLYRLPKKYAQADLEWSPQRFDERLRELIADGFCDYDGEAQVVLIRGAMKYQACSNDNMAKGAARRLAELPETRLTSDFKRLAEQYDERLAKRLPKGFGEGSHESAGQPVNPQALALAQAQAPSPGESPPASGVTSIEQQILESFEKFWAIYPERDGKKVARGNALVEWRKLTVEQRRRAYVGALNYAKSDVRHKDAERFLRKTKGGDYPFDDWQTAATPEQSSNGMSRLANGQEIPL